MKNKDITELVSRETLNKLEHSTSRYFTGLGSISSKGYDRALKVALNEAYRKGMEDEREKSHLSGPIDVIFAS